MSANPTHFSKDDFIKALDPIRNWSMSAWQIHMAKIIIKSKLSFEDYENKIVQGALNINLSENVFVKDGTLNSAEINLSLMQEIYNSKQALKQLGITENHDGSLNINFAEQTKLIFQKYLEDEQTPQVITADEALAAQNDIITLQSAIQDYIDANQADREHLSESYHD